MKMEKFFYLKFITKKFKVSEENILMINLFLDRSFKNIRSITNSFLMKMTSYQKFVIIHNFDDFNKEIQSYFCSIIKNKNVNLFL